MLSNPLFAAVAATARGARAGVKDPLASAFVGGARRRVGCHVGECLLSDVDTLLTPPVSRHELLFALRPSAINFAA